MTTAPFTLCPYRFSADPPAMLAFLETLGLRRLVSTEDDGWGVLAGRRGQVSVHAAPGGATGVGAGDTALVMVVDDPSAAVDALARAGHDAVVWDESYGRQGGVRDAAGHGIWLNEPLRDDYGYRVHPPEPGHVDRIDVVAVHRTPDVGAARTFFADLGFTGPTPQHEGWEPLNAPGAGGTVGLHASDGPAPAGPVSPDDPVSPSALVGLSFATTEPLDDLARRLTATGYAVRDDRDATAPHLTVTDPDGCDVEVHPA